MAAGHRFDPANTGANTALADDLEQADLRRVADMAAAAQLQAVVADLHDADDIAVFLAEQRHSAHCFRFSDRLVLDVHVVLFQICRLTRCSISCKLFRA